MTVDSRNFAGGLALPREGYCDQPYVVITDEGSWLCVMTTGTGVEGEPGQHVISMISSDRGQSWTKPVDVEPADGPEASWAVPLKVPGGRIYVFYTYNDRNMRSVAHDDGETDRVDTLGAFVYRYSDDHGRRWTERRHTIPVRTFDIDRRNPYRGDVKFWWSVSKPIIHESAVYVGFAKVGRFGHGFMAESEGAFIKSTNILTESDPQKVIWETLPDGEVGLRAPQGPVADEPNLAGLRGGSLYCTYRTIDGYSCQAYSRDGGHTWTPPAYATYTPGGRPIKHPRAATFVRELSRGRYILWYHNNGTRWYNNGENQGSRNIAWLTGGREIDGHLHWGQPEIAVYNDDFHRGSSYPDFVEEPDGSLYIVSTQKAEARTLRVDSVLLDGLWRTDARVSADGLILDLKAHQLAAGTSHSHGPLPWLCDDPGATVRSGACARGGVTLDLWVRFRRLRPGWTLLDNRDEGGAGLALLVAAGGSVRLEISDQWTASYWDSDQGLLDTDAQHHIVVVVDGGPRTISFVIDGTLCDGGSARPLGYGRFSPYMKHVSGSKSIRVGDADATLHRLRVYDRALRTAEAVAGFRAGAEAGGD